MQVMSWPSSLTRLIACLSRLPGVGRRSSERMALKIARDPEGLSADLIAALQGVKSAIAACHRCGSITDVSDNPCKLCTSNDRDGSVVCVVEDPLDISAIESSGGFRGRYHALMGKLSPARGDGPENLRIRSLMKRIDDEGFREVLLAVSTDVEGDATAAYLVEALKPKGVRVTRLAFGLPAGSGVMYSDPVTLSRAIRNRTREGA